jgi:hypothetical protein
VSQRAQVAVTELTQTAAAEVKRVPMLNFWRICSQGNDVELDRLLVARLDIDVDEYRDGRTNTSLIMTAHGGYTRCVRLLIGAKAKRQYM